MKKSIPFVLFTLLMVQMSFATVRTVSNSPATLAQFNTIQAAVNASMSGDTILVHGSPVNYGGFTVTSKQLVLLGPGFNPNVQSSLNAKINGNINFNGSACKKSELHGFEMVSNSIEIQSSMDSVYFYRNIIINMGMVNGVGTVSGFIFRGNYFKGGISTHPFSDFHNCLFENNVFVCTNCISGITNGANSNILFNHNLFFDDNGNNSSAFASLGFALFTNNIFVERNFSTTTVFNSTFINNITFNSSPNTPWTLGTNIDGGGNIENMDPMMVDQPLVNSGAATEISDFTIPSGPANNSGSDGKDMGLLFDPTGGLNWNHSRNSRMPSVVLMNIANPVIGAGGSLSVTVEARKNE